MHFFFFADFDPSSPALPEAESHHAVKSLRLQTGEEFGILTGRGDVHQARITAITNQGLDFELVEHLEIQPLTPEIHIAVSPLKQTDRFEWFVEKATEIGVASITPLICSRTERYRFKEGRLERIMVSALKQSGNAFLPELNEAVEFAEFVDQPISGTGFLAHCERGIKTRASQLPLKEQYTILIGPEGDFTEAEINLATSKGYTGLDLGVSTLRTETAAFSICAYLRLNASK